MIIKGIDRLESHAPLHPDFPNRGYRKTVLEGKDGIKIFVTNDDLEKLEIGNRVRLKDLCNIELTSKTVANYIGNDVSIIKEGAKIIHWVYEGIPMKVVMPDGEVKKGICEKELKNGEIVQFERFGFVRVDKTEKFICYYAHR